MHRACHSEFDHNAVGARDDLYANWARVYDLFYPPRDDEVAFWASVARPYGSRLLDLMCGTAEVSLGLAREGFQVLGMDLSPAMLAAGAERLDATADFPARSLALTLGNASHLPIGAGASDFCLVGGNGSFNHLHDGQAAAALNNLARILRPGGGLGLELINPYLLQYVEPERSFGPLRPAPPGVSVEKTVRNRWDPQSGHFEIQQVTRLEVGGQVRESRESFVLCIWQPDAVQALIKAAGFHNVRLCGGYDKTPFDRWSSDLLVVVQTPKG